MSGINRLRDDLLETFKAGVRRVEGRRCVSGALKGLPGEVSLVAIGKAAESMTLGALDVLEGRLIDGLVISKPGHLTSPDLVRSGLDLLEGGHPMPDASSIEAGDRLVHYLRELPRDRQLLFLISGGASGLVEQLREGIDLASLQRINKWLLGGGLPINAMNRVRKAVSKIKGGGLIPLLDGRPTRVLLISDVPGDDPGVIGSGLLVGEPDPLIGLADMSLPQWLKRILPGEPRASLPSADNIELQVVASLADARQAAADKARELGYGVQVFGSHIGGDVPLVGRRLAYELSDTWPGLYIWGGEPTIHLPESPGRGGRNQHLALTVAEQITGNRQVCFLSAGTDGGDGPGDYAGAIVDGGTIGRGRAAGLDPAQCLAAADSGRFLEASGDLIKTGPTGTNVMDLMIGVKL